MMELQTLLQTKDLPITVVKPTASVPLGGNNAAALIIFLTSYTDVSSINNLMDRALRKTLDNLTVPTQIVAISTLGTERTEKMPYSMQNLMGSGKLEKRRQMEEAIMQVVKKRQDSLQLDYTICKLGDLVDDKKKAKNFNMMPGDAVDGALSVETAVQVVAQAMVTRASARNATFSVVGSDPTDAELADAFLRLDGPEVYCEDEMANCEALVQYVLEWSQALASSGKGLTTPVHSRVVPVVHTTAPGVVAAAATQLVFLPTATGQNYKSRDDEHRERHLLSKNSGGAGTAASVKPTTPNSPPRMMMVKQDGGLEFVVEQMGNGLGRVRVKRCNYSDGVIVKELSEETILSSFKKSMDVWRKEHPVMHSST
jgi:hypothetical protein